MKVLHLLSTNSFSGAENVVCQIIDMYKNDKNIEMTYCSPNGTISETLDKKNITFLSLKKFDYNNIKKAIFDYKPDIIHAHDIKASIFASMFSKKINIISHIHGNSLNMRKISLKSILYLISSYKFKHIFWVSNSSLSQYKFYKKVFKKSSVLVNVVNKKDIIEKSKEKKIKGKYDVIFVGRLTELKNPMRLLKIFSSVVDRKPNSKLAIVGTGEMHDEIKSYINENNLNKNIFLLGFQSNPYIYIANSKMMILTSIYEGTPMCALEAMCLSKPIISTPTDGMIDIIRNNINGFLSDSDEQLSNKIVELIDNNDALLFMSKNADKDSTKINNVNNYKEKLNVYYIKNL